MARIQYIGKKTYMAYGVAGTNLIWDRMAIHEVEDPAKAARLLSHTDCWAMADDDELPDEVANEIQKLGARDRMQFSQNAKIAKEISQAIQNGENPPEKSKNKRPEPTVAKVDKVDEATPQKVAEQAQAQEIVDTAAGLNAPPTEPDGREPPATLPNLNDMNVEQMRNYAKSRHGTDLEEAKGVVAVRDALRNLEMGGVSPGSTIND